MKNSKSIKGSGFFTFEEEPTVEIFGKLRISKLGEIFLELMGNDAVPQTHPLFSFMEFTTNRPFRRQPIRSEAIVGEIRSKRGRNIAIRLESNRYFDPQRYQIPLLFPDVWSITLKAEMAFLSKYSRKILTESPSFKMIRFRLNNLNEWSTIRALSMRERASKVGGKSISIDADLPEDLSFPITKGLDFKMQFSHHYKLYDYRRAYMKQQVYLTLVSTTPQCIGDFQQIIDPITKFFCFTTNGSAHLDFVEGFRQKSESHQGVRIFYRGFSPFRQRSHRVPDARDVILVQRLAQ